MAGTKPLASTRSIINIEDRLTILEKYNIYVGLDNLKKAPATTAMPYTLVSADGRIEYSYIAGDYSAMVDDLNVIRLNSVQPTTGALIRQSSRNSTFRQYDGGTFRSAEEKARETISATDYGTKADGTTNDTVNLMLADRKAKAKGKPLFIPAGTYSIDAVTATTSWYGEPGTILKYRGSPSSFVAMVTASGVDNIVFEGIIFDGNCSADPVTWNRASQDGYTGAAGLSVENCKRPKVINCIARNMRQHGFRFYNCSGAVWRDCDTKRTRGNFGDGFIAISCVSLSVSDCYAEDYTRIGYVVDSFGDNIVTCHKVTFSSCFAANGHHASYIYGGSEFNAGFWFEHTADATMNACFAFDNTHRGINICTGSGNNGFPGNQAMISISNSHTVGSDWGILTYSLVGLPVVSKVANCSTKLAKTAFEGAANSSGDSFAWLACHADYDASQPANFGFSCQVNAPGAAVKPMFHIGEGCTVSRWREDLTKLRDEGANAATADIGGYFSPNVALRLTVSGVKASNGGPVYVRWYETNNIAHEFKASDMELWISRGGSAGGTIRISDCTLHYGVVNQGYAESVEIRNCKIKGFCVFSGTTIDVSSCSTKITDSGYLWLLSNATSNYPAIFVTNSRFEKNVASNDYSLRFGFGSVSFQAIVASCLFYNSGSSTTSKAHIAYASGTIRRFMNCVTDSSAYITTLDSGGAFEDSVQGVTTGTMH